MITSETESADQPSIRVRCRCGWSGMAPGELVRMGRDNRLRCPNPDCAALFPVWLFLPRIDTECT